MEGGKKERGRERVSCGGREKEVVSLFCFFRGQFRTPIQNTNSVTLTALELEGSFRSRAGAPLRGRRLEAAGEARRRTSCCSRSMACRRRPLLRRRLFDRRRRCLTTKKKRKTTTTTRILERIRSRQAVADAPSSAHAIGASASTTRRKRRRSSRRARQSIAEEE